MKARHLSILFVLLVIVCLTAGMALGNDIRVFEPLSHRSTLAAPTLTVTTSGTTVSLSWTSVSGATGYILFYAPYPYTGTGSIVSVDMGTQTGISVNLWVRAAFYVAVQAYDSVKSSGYSNIEYFIIASYTNSLGQTFGLLPAGTFTMGSPSDEPGRNSTEGPQHEVTLTQPFYMQITEVTQDQWEAVMGSNPSHFSGCPSCPVENVSWHDVQKYITQMNLKGEGTYSLPTEAQWEYAARAGSTTAFFNGRITNLDDNDPNLQVIGWYYGNAGRKTNPVAGKVPNYWGLYDMSGNVWEWCLDWFDSGYYSGGAMTDPTGPSSGSRRVERGGAWPYYARYCRSANRSSSHYLYRSHNLGFRLLRQP